LKNILRSMLIALAGSSIAATSLVAGGAAPAKATGIEVPQDACADVTVLGLRGGDFYEKLLLDINSGRSADVDPFGTFNSRLADSIKGDLPQDATIKKVVVPYDYVAVNANPHSFGDADKFRVAMKTATGVANDAMAKALSACPQTKLVMVGTDSGAQVAHEALITTPDVERKQIAAVVLTGDPIYDSSDPSQKNYAGQGAAAFVGKGAVLDPFRQALGINSTDWLAKEAPADHLISPLMAGRVMNICKQDDASCFSPSGDGVRASNTYPAYLTSKYLSEPARWVSDKITAMCADITFFAARGSGEASYSGTPVQKEATTQDFKPGFGTPLASLAFAIEQKYAKGAPTTFNHVAVSYEALSVGDATRPWSGYPASVYTGIKPENGPQQFRDLIAACPATRVVMLGYSQGGHVIHEILMGLNAEERSHIATTVLVADAIRNPNDANALTFMGNSITVEDNGSVIFEGMGVMRMVAKADTVCLAQNKLADEQRGEDFWYFIKNPVSTFIFCGLMPALLRFSDVVSPQTYPSDETDRVLNVCSDKDLVCDAKEPLDSNGFVDYETLMNDINDYKIVDRVHGDGYNHPEFYDFSSGWAYRQINGATGDITAKSQK